MTAKKKLDDTTFCEYEGESFPNEDFKDTAEYGRIHFYNVARPHTTLGEVLDAKAVASLQV